MSLLLASLFFLQAAPTAEQKGAAQKKELEAVSQMMHPARSMMVIDPKERANDYVKAWEMLKQEKSSAKVSFTLASGQRISNVIEMKPMPGDTLIVFRYSTPQGIRFQVVEVEDILSLMHQ
ncbi:MAG: hypothetical protein P0S96_00185 [Simkaniaceae bacterium]|nr:hypothetical protein [Candidatus Sacchlamyda saccharinae]